MYAKQERMMQMTFTKLPKAITAEELLSTPLPPVKWIVPGLLPAGLALFAGPSKAGKSWLTLWLCLQVAQGKPVWGREIEPRTVLYLSLEDTLNRLQDRLFRLVGSEDTPEKLILHTECQSIGQGLEEQITSFLYNHSDTGLVVIDTLQKVRSCDQSGSMYASDYKDVSALKSLADKYGICILLIHHLRKQAASDPFDQISGSNGLMGAADTTWVMQRKRTSKNADIILTGRDLDRRTLYLHEENCIWLLDEEETAEEQRLKAVPEYLWKVAEYVEQAGKWQGTATELLSAAGVDGVLPHAKKNDIIPFNPAHRIRKKHFEKEVQHIPQKYEMSKLMRAIQNEPILYRAYYTLAITTGLRRGELCALQWRDITGACELAVRRSRSCASGKIVESDTKSHRERIVTIPLGIWELLMALRQQQVLHSGVPDREQSIFTDPDGHVPHPDTFTRHLRKLYKQCGLSEDYHLHTLRHFYATYLLQEGTSKQVAASLLGHADTAFLERTYCHPQDVAKRQAANLMQDLLNNQNPCYVVFMKNKNRKAKKAG